MNGQDKTRFDIDRNVDRAAAAILSINDTVRDEGDRLRVRRATLDILELLKRRLNELWLVRDYAPSQQYAKPTGCGPETPGYS